MQISRTPVVVPKVGNGIVSRLRLSRHLGEVVNRRLTVVQAPAGFGKSTLLQQWQSVLGHSGHVTARLSLNRHVSDIMGHILSALSEAHPILTERLNEISAPDGFLTTDRELAIAVDCLAVIPNQVILLIDDLHFLAKEEVRVLERFIERMPANAHMTVATRETPALPLGRLRAHGELFEVSMNELRFTVDETRQFLTPEQKEELSDGDIHSLVARTEGWAAGLRLASLAMSRGSAGAKLIASFSGSRSVVADFFSEDVFGSQPKDVQDFLLQTCLLERFSPDLCNAVTGRTNSREMLNRIEVSGLFLVRLDDDSVWFRYHGLFGGFLARRLEDLDAPAVRRIHLAASRWFYENNYIIEALDHAVLASDQHWLAEILEETCEELVYRGKLTFVVGLAEGIDRSIRYSYPRIMLAVAWLRIRNLQIDDARFALDVAANKIAELENAGQSADQIGALRFMLSHREMMYAAAIDDFVTAEELAATLMRQPDELKPYITCNLHGQTIRAQREQFKFQQFERHEARARSVLEKSNYKFAYVAQQAIVGITLFQMCRNDAAQRALEHGMGQAIDFAGENSGLAALPALPLAVVHYERNDLDRVSELLRNYLPVAREFGFSDELMAGYLLVPRLKFARGDESGAFTALETARSLGHEIGLDRIVVHADAEKVRLLLQTGHVEHAAEVARLAEVTAKGRTLSPQINSTMTDEVIARSWVRLAMHQGDLAEALQLVQRWKQFCFHRNATRHLIGWNLLQAQALMMTGDSRAALRSLREALVAAAEGTNRRIFLDEGQRVRDLLTEAYGSGPMTKQPADLLAYELLNLFESRSRSRECDAVPSDTDEEVGIDGKMTGREIEILTCVASGLRNKEIGGRLGLTEGSVKWYMQRIYDKVGTRRRSLAVERARQFGFLQ